LRKLRLEVQGDPFAVSICNCRACQHRTGSAFGMQAGFRSDQVRVVGHFSDYSRVSDEADKKEHVFHFCPDCGSQDFYTEPTEPDLIVVSVGSFADPSFPPPTESGYDSWRHPWVGLPDSIQRPGPDVWDSVRPLYDAGRYAEAAAKGGELIEAHPDDGQLYYNTACCESLAGEPAPRRRKPPARDRAVGGFARDGQRRLRLRPDPGRARLPGSPQPVTQHEPQ
jgi:hypothetical protein